MKQENSFRIAKWKDNASAALTLSFDDGYKNTFESCIHHLDEYKLKSTWNIPTSYPDGILEGREVASWHDISEIAGHFGIEIASHSVNHLDSFSSPQAYLRKIFSGLYHAQNKVAYLRQIMKTAFDLLSERQQTADIKKEKKYDIAYEVTESKNEIDKKLMPKITSSYVYPHGKCDNHYKDIVRSAGYISARGTTRGYNTYKTLEFFDLRCMVLNKHTTVKEADDWVRKAMEKCAWLIEAYHLVAENNPDNYDYFTRTDVFRQHIEHIADLVKNNKIWVDTQQNIAKYMKQRLASEITILHQDSNQFALRLDSKLTQPSDQKITLIVENPGGRYDTKVSQGNSPMSVKKDDNYILFDVLPDKDDILIEVVGKKQ